MSEHAKELHDKLTDYEIFETTLNNKRVEKLRAFGFNAINLSGVIITKHTAAQFGEDASIVSITELESIDSENKLKKVTDYVHYGDGEFSEVDQNTTLISSAELTNITILQSAIDTVTDFMNLYEELERTNAPDQDLINCETKLSQAVGYAYRVLEHEKSLKSSIGEYGPSEHSELMQKLGSLVLDLDDFYGPFN